MQAEEYQQLINELKRKFDAVTPAPAPEPPVATAAEPEEEEEGGKSSPRYSPPAYKKHKSSGSKDSKFKEAVLKVVKRRLDGELKRGSITQGEYKDIAKRATNKVMSKNRGESVSYPPAFALLPVHIYWAGSPSSVVFVQEPKEKKILSLVSEYVSQAKKRRDM